MSEIVEAKPATQIANPFASSSVSVPTDSATASTDAARAIAEVQAALVVARMNPRNEQRSMDRIINACSRPTLANTATYAYARGGTSITGPSIRLAEALAQGWGNIQYGIRELSQTNGVSTVQAFAWDVETNTRREVVFQVALKRDTRKGSYKLTDGRDIYELVANQGARRLRACILSVIPGDVVEAALAQCALTQKAHVDISDESLKSLAEAFAEFGVSKSQIEKRIQRRLDAIMPAQYISLRNIYRSIRDGMSRPEEWFDPEPEAGDAATKAKGSAGLKARMKKSAPSEALPQPEKVAPEEAAPVIDDEPKAEAKADTIDPADYPDTGEELF